MPDFAEPIVKLIDELKRLPGIGQKTPAPGLSSPARTARAGLALSEAIRQAKLAIRECSVCNNITDSDPCLYCSGPTRNRKIICVVEHPHNIWPSRKRASIPASITFWVARSLRSKASA